MAVAGYKIKFRETAGGPSTVVDVGNVLEYDLGSINGIDPEVEYAVSRAAYDGSGNLSAYSDEEIVTSAGPFDPVTSLSWIAFQDAEALSQADGSNVATWANPGSGADFTNTGGTPPTFDAVNPALNNKKAVMFNAISESLAANLGVTNPCTVFAVFAKSSTGLTTDEAVWQSDIVSAGGFWFYYDLFNAEWRFTQNSVVRADAPLNSDVPEIWRFEFGASTTKIFINGVEITDDNTSTMKPGGTIYLGSWPSNTSGSLTEQPVGIFAISTSLLTAPEVAACEDFWAARYGITLP